MDFLDWYHLTALVFRSVRYVLVVTRFFFWIFSTTVWGTTKSVFRYLVESAREWIIVGNQAIKRHGMLFLKGKVCFVYSESVCLCVVVPLAHFWFGTGVTRVGQTPVSQVPALELYRALGWFSALSLRPYYKYFEEIWRRRGFRSSICCCVELCFLDHAISAFREVVFWCSPQ